MTSHPNPAIINVLGAVFTAPIFYSLSSCHTGSGLFAYFFLKMLRRNRYTVYTTHRPKKIPQAMQALAKDPAAKLRRNSSGAIITMAGNVDKIYRLEVGVRRLGSISFIRIMPLEAVPVMVPKLIRKNSCSKPLKQRFATLRI